MKNIWLQETISTSRRIYWQLYISRDSIPRIKINIYFNQLNITSSFFLLICLITKFFISFIWIYFYFLFPHHLFLFFQPYSQQNLILFTKSHATILSINSLIHVHLLDFCNKNHLLKVSSTQFSTCSRYQRHNWTIKYLILLILSILNNFNGFLILFSLILWWYCPIFISFMKYCCIILHPFHSLLF